MTVLYQYNQSPDWYVIAMVASIVLLAASIIAASEVKKVFAKVIVWFMVFVFAATPIVLSLTVKQETYIYAVFEDFSCYEDFENHYTFHEQKGDLYILKLTGE